MKNKKILKNHLFENTYDAGIFGFGKIISRTDDLIILIWFELNKSSHANVSLVYFISNDNLGGFARRKKNIFSIEL